MASEKFVIIRGCTHRAKANVKDKAKALNSLILNNFINEHHIKIIVSIPKNSDLHQSFHIRFRSLCE